MKQKKSTEIIINAFSAQHFEKYKALGTLEEMGLPSDSEGGQVFKGPSCRMA